MMVRSAWSMGIVVCGGLVISGSAAGCGTNEADPTPVPQTTAGSSGATATVGGSSAGGGSGVPGSGASAGTGTGGGLMPINGSCPPRSLKNPMTGLCTCQPMTLTACPNGCGDLQTDPDRCGNCDTKCGATQACNAGKCDAAPTTLVPATVGCGSMKLAASGDKVYFTDQLHGTVTSVAKTGGAATPLVQNQMQPTSIAVTAHALFWIASGSKSLMTASLTGESPTALATATSDLGGFTLSADGMTAYFSVETKVNKVSATPGGAVTEVGHEDTGIPKALAVSGNLLAFPADLNGDVDVMTMGAAPAVCASEDSTTAKNSNCKRLARSQGSIVLDAIYIVAGKAYWANGTAVTSAPTDQNNALNDIVVQSPSPVANTITALAIAGETAYFADDDGGVYSSPLTVGATAKVLARGQGKPTAIAVDDTHVYWASDCAISSVPLE
jgi:hypothetical protein